MKAILVNEDKSLRWGEVPNPILKPDEVLVKIEAAALNRADLMQREGDYPPPAGCPEWMGLEIAGEIVEIGPRRYAVLWKKGDENNGELYGLESHNLCLAELRRHGWVRAEDDWCFERYACPRFTAPDADGRVILDYGIALEV